MSKVKKTIEDLWEAIFNVARMTGVGFLLLTVLTVWSWLTILIIYLIIKRV